VTQQFTSDRHAPELIRAYEEALFDIHLPDGAIVVSVGDPIGHAAPLLTRRFTVITAYNPNGQDAPELDNRRRMQNLEADIRAQGWEYYSAVGHDAEWTHQEPSFAVLDRSREEAHALGARYNQACVFYWDGRRGTLVWSD